jgi:hypothetical protein
MIKVSPTFKILAVIALLAVIVIIIYMVRKSRSSSNIQSGPFFDALYTWILSHEGGLQDHQIAGDIGKERSPCVITVGDRVYHGPFTNKGIDYSLFKKYAPRFGYSIDCKTFASMPLDLWSKIYQTVFYSKGSPYSKNPVLAAYVTGWFWGSGSISTTNIKRIKDILASSASASTQLTQLIALRKSFFASLHTSNPDKYPQTVVNAWNARQDSFWDNFHTYLS